MFTWICPQCGREVPPSYTECPDCQNKETQPAPPPAAAAAVTQPQAEYAPQAYPQQAYTQQSYAQQPYTQQGYTQQATPPPPPAAPQQVRVAPYQPPPAPAARGGLPTWLLTVVFAFAFLGLGAGIYWLVGAAKGSGSKPSVNVESPAAKPGAKVNALQKYVEVSGVRFIEDAKKKTQVKFIITNHSPAEIGGLAGNVTVWGRTRTSEEDAAGTFTFNTNLGPWESKELSAPLNTKLKIYELPDWQNVSTDIQITSPGA